MAAALTITPSSYNGAFEYVNDGGTATVSGSFCVDASKIVSFAGEIADVGTFKGSYDNVAQALLYELSPASLDTADDLAALVAEAEAALQENFFPTTPDPDPDPDPDPAPESPAAGEGGEGGEGGGGGTE